MWQRRYFVDVNGYRVCEANSAPGFQGLEKARGISVPEEIFKVVQKKGSISITARDTSSAPFPNSDAPPPIRVTDAWMDTSRHNGLLFRPEPVPREAII
jgi:hypothetical protein